MAFSGFSSDALAFLEALPTRDPAWFKANKVDYQRLIADPTKEFVTALGDALAEERPDIVAQPKTNGSISPINNDLRFSPDKPPYKDHLMVRMWEGANKKVAPTLFVRMSSTDVGFASGLMPADVNRWRQVIDGPAGAELAAELDAVVKAKLADVAGEGLKRVPAPYPADHPRADLLRHKMFQVRWSEPMPASVDKPTFVDWCMRRLEVCLPVHRVLVEAFS